MRYYGADIRLIGMPELTWRRFRVLLEGLPADSLFAAANAGLTVEERAWTLDRHLAAGFIEQAAWTNYLLGALVAQGSEKLKKNPVPEPKPIPRPGIKPDKGRHGKGMKSLVRALGAPV